MKNECFNVAAIVTGGAVVAFFACLGWMSRVAYWNGYAVGFNAARERFRKIIDAAGARKLFKEFENDIDADGRP